MTYDDHIKITMEFRMRDTLANQRACVDSAWSYAAISRSEDQRAAELSDLFLFSVPLQADPDDGQQECMCLCYGSTSSKMNKDANKDVGLVTRFKDIRICPCYSISTYLFSRFGTDVVSDIEEPPDFNNYSQWFDSILILRRDWKVLRGEYKHKQVSYQAQRALYHSVMRNELKISSSHLTHESRHLSANRCKSLGVDNEKTHNGGRWKKDKTTCEKSYLNSLEPDVILTLAGYDFRKREYHLPRGRVIPSKTLVFMIYPWLEQYEGVIFEDIEVDQFKCTEAVRKVFYWLAVVSDTTNFRYCYKIL
jgi:hypothetical protein